MVSGLIQRRQLCCLQNASSIQPLWIPVAMSGIANASTASDAEPHSQAASNPAMAPGMAVAQHPEHGPTIVTRWADIYPPGTKTLCAAVSDSSAPNGTQGSNTTCVEALQTRELYVRNALAPWLAKAYGAGLYTVRVNSTMKEKVRCVPQRAAKMCILHGCPTMSKMRECQQHTLREAAWPEHALCTLLTCCPLAGPAGCSLAGIALSAAADAGCGQDAAR